MLLAITSLISDVIEIMEIASRWEFHSHTHIHILDDDADDNDHHDDDDDVTIQKRSIAAILIRWSAKQLRRLHALSTLSCYMHAFILLDSDVGFSVSKIDLTRMRFFTLERYPRVTLLRDELHK